MSTGWAGSSPNRFGAVGGSVLAAGGLLYGGLLVFLRGRPSIDLDAGVFLSVAARLLHGDHLYSQVWDNKDPLFFYTDAAALWVAGWRGPFLLDILWVAIAAVAIVLLLDVLGASTAAMATGFVTYPLLLTGEWYYAGYSMLAALALAPLAAWLWARGSPLLAGIVVAAGVLFKINLALVLLAAPAALLAIGVPDRRRWGLVGRFVAGSGGLVLIAAIVMAARGELRPYGQMLRANVSYANDVLVATGRIGGIHGHIRVAATSTRHEPAVIAAFVLVAAVAVWVVVRTTRSSRTPLGATAALFLAVAGASAITLASTAAWNHHVQMLAYPGALLGVFAVAELDSVVRMRWLSRTCQAGAVAATVLLLGGVQPVASLSTISTWFDDAHSRTANALLQVRSERLSSVANVSYAHLGQNDEEADAAFIGHGWTLSCARFHQYPWTPAATLRSILRCVETRRPRLLLITSSLSDRPGAPVAWHQFVAAGHSVAQRDYKRVYFLRHAHGTVAVWIRRRPG
jgi:hypothetical protein